MRREPQLFTRNAVEKHWRPVSGTVSPNIVLYYIL